MKTMTIRELKKILSLAPDNAKIYLSQDSEGNGYSTLDNMSIEYTTSDKAIILYPHHEGLDYGDICPISNAQIEKELNIERSK